MPAFPDVQVAAWGADEEESMMGNAENNGWSEVVDECWGREERGEYVGRRRRRFVTLSGDLNDPA